MISVRRNRDNKLYGMLEPQRTLPVHQGHQPKDVIYQVGLEMMYIRSAIADCSVDKSKIWRDNYSRHASIWTELKLANRRLKCRAP